METHVTTNLRKDITIILTGTDSIGSNLYDLLLDKKEDFYVTNKFFVQPSSLRILKNIYHHDLKDECIFNIDTKNIKAELETPKENPLVSSVVEFKLG